MADMTHDEIHAHVRTGLLADTRTPRGIRLGQTQQDAILAYHRQVSGAEDVGPLTEFAGVPVLKSRATDRLVLEYDGDTEDEDAPTSVTLPVTEEQPAQ
jgi:hypothetical protein